MRRIITYIIAMLVLTTMSISAKNAWEYRSVSAGGAYETAATWDDKVPSGASLDKAWYLYGAVSRTGDISSTQSGVIYGTFTVSGNFSCSNGGAFSIESGATLEVFGNLNSSQTVTVNPGGTLIVHGNFTNSGGGSTTLAGNVVVLGNVDFKNTSVSNTGNLVVGGTLFTVQNGGGSYTGDVYVLNPDATVSVPQWGPLPAGNIKDLDDFLTNEQNNTALNTIVTAVGLVTNGTSWKGVDNNWDNAANWTKGVPTASTNVIIPVTASKSVIKTGSTATCKNLSIEPGATLTLEAGGKFVVNGNITCDANSLILQNTSVKPASFINYGTISASVQTEWTYVEGAQFWYVSNSVNGALASDYGVLTGAARDVAIYKWPTNWTGNTITDGTTPLNENLMGYAVYFKNPNTKVVSKGTLNTGDMTRSALSASWHLMANPYPAYIDLEKTDQWDFGQAIKSIWITTDVSPGTRGFATYNSAVGVGTNGGSRYIAPGQSFWIRTYTTNDVFTIKAGARVVTPTGTLKSSKAASSDVFRLTIGNKVSKDEMVMVFRSIGSEDFVSTDSEKRLQAPAKYPQVYSLKGENQLAISTLPIDVNNKAIPLGYLPVANETVVLKATNIEAFMPDVKVELEDKDSGVFYDLRVTPEVSVGVTGTTPNQARFVLHLNRVVAEKAAKVEEDKAPSEVTEKIAEETVKGTTQTTGTDEDTTVGSEKQTTESSGDSTTESADNKQATGAASKAAAVATNVTNTSVSTSPDMIVITAFDGRLRVLVQNPDYQRAILVKMYSVTGELIINDTFVGDLKEYPITSLSGHYVVRVSAQGVAGAKVDKRVVMAITKK